MTARPAEGGLASDLRGLSAELLISLAGLVTSAAIVALNFLLRRSVEVDLLDLSVAVVLPAGAFIGGIAAASGYYLGARATHTLPSKRMLFEMLAITLSTWFLAEWLSYALLRFPNGVAVRDVVSFWEYFQVKTEHMQLSFESHGGSELARTRDLGLWGYGREAIQIGGYLCGGLVMWLGLRRLEACVPCGRYARTRKLLHRATSAVLEELLRRAEIVLPDLSERVRAAVGGRRLVGLNLSIAECPSCERRWVRPAAVVMSGSHPMINPLSPYDIEARQAVQLCDLAPVA